MPSFFYTSPIWGSYGAAGSHTIGSCWALGRGDVSASSPARPCLVLLRAPGSYAIATSLALVLPDGSTTLGLCFLLLLAGSWLAHDRNQSSLGAPRWVDNHWLMPCVAEGVWLAHHRRLARTRSEPVEPWCAQVARQPSDDALCCCGRLARTPS